jgi:hypothetical protein
VKAVAKSKCDPNAPVKFGIGTACNVSLICQRCHNCLIHCCCAPLELRARDLDKLAESVRKSVVERAPYGYKPVKRAPTPRAAGSPPPTIESIAEDELQQRIKDLERELQEAREVSAFAMAQLGLKP